MCSDQQCVPWSFNKKRLILIKIRKLDWASDEPLNVNSLGLRCPLFGEKQHTDHL